MSAAKITGGRKENTNLIVNDSSETGFAFNNGIRNTHFPAQGRKEDDQLNGINIIWDENQARLLVLNQANNVIQTILDDIRLFGDVFFLLSVLDGHSLLGQTLLLLSLGLRTILVEETEDLGGEGLVEDVLELSDRRRDLQTEVEDLLAALEKNILRPFHHARKVSSRLDVLTDTEVAWTLLNERILGYR